MDKNTRANWLQGSNRPNRGQRLHLLIHGGHGYILMKSNVGRRNTFRCQDTAANLESWQHTSVREVVLNADLQEAPQAEGF